MQGLLRHFKRYNKTDIQKGDVVLVRIDEHAQHVAVVGDYTPDGFSLIHAYAPARAVVEHALDAWWRERIQAAFRVIICRPGS